MVAGKPEVLATAGLQVIIVTPDWRTQLLAVITNPNIAYLLMLLVAYGLIFELMNPGTVLPGTVGAISLLTALFHSTCCRSTTPALAWSYSVSPSWSRRPSLARSAHSGPVGSSHSFSGQS